MGNWKKFISNIAPAFNFAKVSIFQAGETGQLVIYAECIAY